MRHALHILLLAACVLCRTVMGAETTILDVAVFPALDQIVNASLPAWNALHPDVKIRVLSRSYEDHHNAMLAALAGGEPQFDVIAVEIDGLRQFAESGGLENLARLPYKGLLYRKNFVDYTFPLAASSKGELIAMPADIAPGTLFYRRDVLDKAGVSEADLLASWESYIEAGKKIKVATGAYLAAQASEVGNLVMRSNLKDGEGVYFDKSSKPLVEAPRFVKAFEVAKAIRDDGLDANVKRWSPEWLKGFQRGTIATQMAGAWFGGYLANDIAPKTAGLWRVSDLPAGTFFGAGGTYYAIPKQSSNKAMAWEFIKFMTLNKGIQIAAFKMQNAFPALLEAQVDPFFEQPVDFFGGQKVRTLWRKAARRIPSISISEYDHLGHDIVEEELRKVLEEGKDIPSALHDARMAIERTIASESHQP